MPRSPSELLEASKHIQYEMGMFFENARLLASGLHKGTPIENALLESFTIHARALTDFFFPPPKRQKDDVVATDYVADWEVSGGTMPPEFEKVGWRVGKEIAHITYARLAVTPEAKAWSITAIEGAMGSVVGRFLSVVRPEVFPVSVVYAPSTAGFVGTTTGPTLSSLVSSPSATNAVFGVNTQASPDNDEK